MDAAKRHAMKNATAIASVAWTVLLAPAAQSYPAKPIRFLVGFAAAGTNDIVARAFAQKLTENLGQSVRARSLTACTAKSCARSARRTCASA